jgi:dihydrofolate reductase
MRKLIVSEFVSLDGVIEQPSWTFEFGSPEQERYKYEELFASDALLLGRVTYQGFAQAWPTMTDEVGFADRMNSVPKYVVSTTLKKGMWNNTTIISSNVVNEIRTLKTARGQAILVGGSGRLVDTLKRHDLVDEYRLMVFPVVVGKGQRLFIEGSEPKKFQLSSATVLKSGVTILTYARG